MDMEFLFMILEQDQKQNGKMEKEMENVYILLHKIIFLFQNIKMEN